MSGPSLLLHLRAPEGNSSSRVASARLPDNSVTIDLDAVIRVLHGHLAGMFSAQVPDTLFEVRVLDVCVSLPQVPNDFGMGLTASTSLSELERVLGRMKTGSAPGPDGLPTEFYRSFWPDVGPVLVRAFLTVSWRLVSFPFLFAVVALFCCRSLAGTPHNHSRGVPSRF